MQMFEAISCYKTFSGPLSEKKTGNVFETKGVLSARRDVSYRQHPLVKSRRKSVSHVNFWAESS